LRESQLIILGVSDFYPAAAAVLTQSGALEAVRQERPPRIKNFGQTPTMTVDWLLKRHGLKPEQVNVLALAGHTPVPALDGKRRVQLFREAARWHGRVRGLLRRSPLRTLIQRERRRERHETCLALGFRPQAIQTYDLHECLAAAAYFGQDTRDEPVVVITLDGRSDELCSTVSIGRNHQIHRRIATDGSHSFAALCSVVTYMMGMVPHEDEHELMARAPYASPAAARQIADRLCDLFSWSPDGNPTWQRRRGVPHTMHLQSTLESVFFEQRIDAVLSGVQLFVEEMVCELVRRAVSASGIRRVAISGGILINAQVSKRIAETGAVKHLFLFPSCDDAAGAIGAAYLARSEHLGGADALSPASFSLGPDWSEVEIHSDLEHHLVGGEITGG
jgi:carbamoyltransferase